MYIRFLFVISFNKIANLSINFGLNHELYGSYYRKNTRVGRKLLLIA